MKILQPTKTVLTSSTGGCLRLLGGLPYSLGYGRSGVVAAEPPNLNLTVAHPSLQARLRVYGRAVNNRSAIEFET